MSVKQPLRLFFKDSGQPDSSLYRLALVILRLLLLLHTVMCMRLLQYEVFEYVMLYFIVYTNVFTEYDPILFRPAQRARHPDLGANILKERSPRCESTALSTRTLTGERPGRLCAHAGTESVDMITPLSPSSTVCRA
eukprot:6407870-Pyramimonas_sp.AAC.1